MNFWQLNTKKVIKIYVPIITILFYFFYCIPTSIHNPSRFSTAIRGTAMMSIMIYTVFIIPGINSFKVIRRLTKDTTERSILPLFDSDYTIGLQHENSWLFFTIPCIKATICELPVTISFISSSRSRWSKIDFNFSPLSLSGSKRIYGTGISFTVYLEKRLQKDVKPDILQCVKETKEKGYVSGADRPISTKHYEQYAD